MTNKQMDNRAKKIQDIERQIKELEEKADAIRDELKAELSENGEDERNTGNFVIRWKEIISNRFDTKAFKSAKPEIYEEYVKEINSKRFSVTAA